MQDKQPLCSSEAQLRAPRLAEWGPTPETTGGCTPGAEASCPNHRPKAGDPRAAGLRLKAAPQARVTQAQSGWIGLQCKTQSQSGPLGPCDSAPKQLDLPATRDSGPKWLECRPVRLRPRGGDQPAPEQPRPQVADRLINSLAACEGPHLQLLPNPCALSPAGPTGSLGQRQNTQQRGDCRARGDCVPRKDSTQ